MNRNILTYSVLLLVLTFGLTSCEVIGDLVEFGVWLGVIIVVAVIAIIYWIYRKIKR